MNTFTSRDLTAGAFPQVGVDPLDVQRLDREPRHGQPGLPG